MFCYRWQITGVHRHVLIWSNAYDLVVSPVEKSGWEINYDAGMAKNVSTKLPLRKAVKSCKEYKIYIYILLDELLWKGKTFAASLTHCQCMGRPAPIIQCREWCDWITPLACAPMPFVSCTYHTITLTYYNYCLKDWNLWRLGWDTFSVTPFLPLYVCK